MINHQMRCEVDSLNGAVVCWGWGERGQASPLGGEFSSVSAGMYHTCGVRTSGAVACWGSSYDDAPNRDPVLPPEGRFASVSADETHTCGLRTSGTVVCWSRSHYERFPSTIGEFTSISTGVRQTCGLTIDESVACWVWDEPSVVETDLKWIPNG